jgi:hypothetical protein
MFEIGPLFLEQTLSCFDENRVAAPWRAGFSTRMALMGAPAERHFTQ